MTHREEDVSVHQSRDRCLFGKEVIANGYFIIELGKYRKSP